MALEFSISDKPIDVIQLYSQLNNHAAGALIVFEGRVRNQNEGKPVVALGYEAHDIIAEKEGLLIMKEAHDKFDIMDAIAVHRKGHLNLGDLAVWVGVIAGHRDGAYRASRYIIDELKQRVPIWKKEHYAGSEDNGGKWLEGALPE